MQAMIGLLMIISGVFLGMCVGIWWAFIGGIVDIITEIRAANMDAMSLAIGIAKVLFSGFLGHISAAALALPGYAMIRTS